MLINITKILSELGEDKAAGTIASIIRTVTGRDKGAVRHLVTLGLLVEPVNIDGYKIDTEKLASVLGGESDIHYKNSISVAVNSFLTNDGHMENRDNFLIDMGILKSKTGS